MDYFLYEVPSFIPSSYKNRVNGKIVTHPHEALYYWSDLINSSKIHVPFEVIPVDSHADLGLGY